MTAGSIPPLDAQALMGRQQRLAEALAGLGCRLAVLTRPESVRWLTGAWVGPLFTPSAAIDDQARVSLVLPSRKAESPSVAASVLTYEEKRLSTMLDACEQLSGSIAVLLDHLPNLPARAACEFTAAPRQLVSRAAVEWVDLDPVMFTLRRRKDADELTILRRANEANRRMYERARELIGPGLNELDLFNELHAVAVRELGEPPSYFGQDFRCNARGGAPRDREAQAGELWILDLGVGLRGYHTDNARTISVGEPDHAQVEAWRRVAAVFPLIEETAGPGVRCAELFEHAQKELAAAVPWVFNHHLGHGVGLAPHEAPRLNPNWDDVLAPGDYFTVEPGLYHEELRHGIRLEQNYVVTEQGVELQTPWPLELGAG